MLDDHESTPVYGKKKPLKISNAMFAWTLVILLLLGLAIASWFGSIYVFGHPEHPFSYKILQKLKKIDAPKRFEITDAPRGEFLNAKQLYERYGSLPPRELSKINAALLRNYLRNFNQTTDLVPYVIGDFNILDSFDLTENDVFPSGVVAIAQSKENRKVLIEHVFPADAHTTPLLQRALLTGLDINLERKFDLSAILHIQRISGGRILITAMPIVYGSYTSTEGPGTYSLEPPQDLHLDKQLPLIQGKRLEEASKKYANYLHRLGLDKAAEFAPQATHSPTPPANYLVRVEKPSAESTPRPEHAIQPTPTPAKALSKKERAKLAKTEKAAHQAQPVARAEAVDQNHAHQSDHLNQPVARAELVTEPHIARAEPVAANEPHIARAEPVASDQVKPAEAISVPEAAVPGQLVAPPPQQQAAALASPFQAPNPNATASPSPSASPTTATASISPSSAAISNTASGKWDVYAPGQMPRGRLLDVPDMTTLASKGTAGERLYLHGDFVVTASGSNRAVLRSKSAVSNPLGGNTSNIRIIVDYPAGSPPPEKGVAFSRDSDRPFLITDVSPPGPDGQINVRVREITK